MINNYKKELKIKNRNTCGATDIRTFARILLARLRFKRGTFARILLARLRFRENLIQSVLIRVKEFVRVKEFILIATLFPLLFISCGTTLSFNVDHPPLVDLRNMKSITVLPFEWNVSIRYSHLAPEVTEALVYGIRKSSLNYIDPTPLRHVSNLELYKYTDVYITGRINNVSVSDHVQTREEPVYNDRGRGGGRGHGDRDRGGGRDGGGRGDRGHDDRGRGDRGHDRGRGRNDNSNVVQSVIRTVTVEIEYTYIRASNNEVLGHFKKSAASYDSSDNAGLDRSWRMTQSYHPDTWTDNIAAAAIKQFTVSREIGPWTMTEKRTLKGNACDPAMSEADKMIRQRYYGRAFEIYNETYERAGNINAGYNLAVLLQFDGKYSEALELLEEIQLTFIASGKKVPEYITNEIVKIKGFIDGFIALDGYKRNSED